MNDLKKEIDYKTTAVVDSFARGIQLPIKEFRQLQIQMKSIFKDNEDFMCRYYQCFFLDSLCSDNGIMDRLKNFTI